MAPESQEEIHFPVTPAIEQGFVEIQLEVASQAGRKFLSHKVKVLVSCGKYLMSVTFSRYFCFLLIMLTEIIFIF